MNQVTKIYKNTCIDFETTFLQFLERPLLLTEKNALRNAGSFQMLESFSRGIDGIENKEQAIAQMKKIMELKRLPDFVEMFVNRMTENQITLFSELEQKLLDKGNILDIMLLWEEIEEQNLGQTTVNELQTQLLAALEQRN